MSKKIRMIFTPGAENETQTDADIIANGRREMARVLDAFATNSETQNVTAKQIMERWAQFDHWFNTLRAHKGALEALELEYLSEIDRQFADFDFTPTADNWQPEALSNDPRWIRVREVAEKTKGLFIEKE